MCALLLEVACVLAVLLLLWIMRQLTSQATWMGQIEDNQAFCHRWQVHRELPGDRSTPIVTDNNGFVSPKVTNDGLHVSQQVFHRIVLATFRFVAQIVATQ